MAKTKTEEPQSKEKELAVDPIANLMPDMSPSEYEELKSSIERDGLQQAVVLYKGRIIDGKNRYRACRETNTNVRTVEYKGDNPLAFALAANLTRRHLTASQRAIIAARLESTERAKQGTKRAKKGSGGRTALSESIHVSPRYIQSAAEIVKHPEIADKVLAGHMTIQKALSAVARAATKSGDLLSITEQTGPEIPQLTEKYHTLLLDPPWELLLPKQLMRFPLPAWLEPGAQVYITCGYAELCTGAIAKLLKEWGLSAVSLTVLLPKDESLTDATSFVVRAGASDIITGSLPPYLLTKQTIRQPKALLSAIEQISKAPRILLWSRKDHEGWQSWNPTNKT
jgi:hypothetical protein